MAKASQAVSHWRWLAAVVLPVVIAGIALGSFLYVRVFRPHALRVRDADRQLLITVADLEAFLPRFVARTDAELLTATNWDKTATDNKDLAGVLTITQ